MHYHIHVAKYRRSLPTASVSAAFCSFVSLRPHMATLAFRSSEGEGEEEEEEEEGGGESHRVRG
jgi:hypothetical protein